MNILETHNPVNAPLLISQSSLLSKVEELSKLSVSSYTREVLQPVESPDRMLPEEVIHRLADHLYHYEKKGPLITAVVDILGQRVAVVAQSRDVDNGVFQPEHHKAVETFLDDLASQDPQCPVVTFIDTPGADAGDIANRNLQAHSISSLIARFTKMEVPSIGIIWGKGFSGGAIPFAATNRLFAVRDGLFNTIQPQGLAAIARRQGLSWQECAQLVGLSAYELAIDGVVDGVIDLSPLDISGAEIDDLKSFIIYQLESLSDELTVARKFNKSTEDKQVIRYNDLRWWTLRGRLHYSKNYCVDAKQVAGKKALTTEIDNSGFQLWMETPHPINYELELKPYWDRYNASQHAQKDEARYRLALELSLYLYHQWQENFEGNVVSLIDKLQMTKSEVSLGSDPRVEEILLLGDLSPFLVHHLTQLRVLEKLYAVLIAEAPLVAREYSKSERKELSFDTMNALLIKATDKVDGSDTDEFSAWLDNLESYNVLYTMVDKANQWKKKANPRMEDVLLISIGYAVAKLVVNLHRFKSQGVPFDGSFSPTTIGRTKNFWHRLTETSRNVRMQSYLQDSKRQLHLNPEWFIKEWVADFKPLNAELETSNKKQFPGFDSSIGSQHAKGSKATGLITGIADIVVEGNSSQVGLFVSNSTFQAGAFDMSSAEKFCRLLDTCRNQNLPVLGFIASGGMQTKEGASALFSMAVVNEAINRFSVQSSLNISTPIMIVGYGDCTGGAQASLVTHPMVKTCYLSATNMPFAGQLVVPQHLSLQSTLSNYLSRTKEAMDVVIEHPTIASLDEDLQSIDPGIPLSQGSLDDIVGQWLSGSIKSEGANEESRQQEIHNGISKTYGPIKKVLIHARGCTAARLIDTAQVLGKDIILVQSDPDMQSGLAERLGKNDQLICLGGSTPDESYLNADSILRIAELNQVDAIHPGIGFLSENADFARLCVDKGFNFIGPDAFSIELMGDKAQAIKTAAEIGLPTVPGSQGAVETEEQALSIAQRIKYPLLIKSSFGGGGKGIAVVNNDQELIENFSRLSREAASAFGNGELYMERYLQSVRHIEVQVLRDSLGYCKILGVRDCSVQRSRQKIVEESGEYVLSAEQQENLRHWSQKISDHISYVGAGTVEFLYDLINGEFYFMEMNTRLQVEHPVTEFTSGIDIVAKQFAIAEGQSIDQEIDSVGGHAIELRINAENISYGEELTVMPSTGVITQFEMPDYPWARVLSFTGVGKEITPFYDSLIAQIIVHGENRNQAIERLSQFLEESEISGVNTNMNLLESVICDPVFQEGKYGTSFLENFFERQPMENNGDEEGDSELERHFEIHGDDVYLKAPSSGVAYLSSAPGEDSFVKKGQLVSAKDTLLLLEVMKVFMPMKLSSFVGQDDVSSYRIEHVRISDEDYVQAGDVVMILKKALS